MSYKITETCHACGKCCRRCPVQAIKKSGNIYAIDLTICIGCGECAAICPFNAIAAVDGSNVPSKDRLLPDNVYVNNRQRTGGKSLHRKRKMRVHGRHGILNKLKELFVYRFFSIGKRRCSRSHHTR
ncbi:DUF362 domain-containing protein [Pectinatus cerevisiiphilus]|uniref:4Fe-4S binding protein n=1 Tax=Pectinatus cerevisiiphilus TaxID=86956 RepID=A0A4R3KF90_9FIRM|nr:4Fe-4S binding protein [Pectinatus cerevisiiphilus]TCS81850.1 4Fe-4S binding protein [Pectinatus cerevisiiphilus]